MHWRGRAAGTRSPPSCTSWATRPSASSARRCRCRPAGRRSCSTSRQIRLDVLEHVSIEWARIFNALVVYEDDRTLVVAAARPEDAIVPARELGTSRGKSGRAAHRARRHARAHDPRRVPQVEERRARTSSAPRSSKTRKGPYLAIVQPDGGEDEHRLAQRALAEDAARNIESHEELPSEEHPSSSTLTGDWHVNTITTSTRRRRRTRWSRSARR